MGSLKQTIRRTKNYIFIKTYKRPLLFVIVLMVFVNLAILAVAAFLALGIDDTYSSFFDAFFNGSLKWMLSPNAILTITNPRMLALAVTILIIGLILFSGTIIALTTNAIKEYFQTKKDNAGKIDLDDHIVILNWNSKVPELVSDLLYLDAKVLTIMIVTLFDKAQAEALILNALKRDKKQRELVNLNVLVKQADPLLIANLRDISIQDAKAVIVMNKEESGDLHVIKNVLTLSQIRFRYAPHIVVEIAKAESDQKLRTLATVVKDLGEHTILPVCFDQRLGQIIAQTMIEERLETLYHALFSFEGSEVYRVVGASFDTVLQSHSHAIPVMTHKEDTFALSLSRETASRHTDKPLAPTIALKFDLPSPSSDFDIVILGNNNKLTYIKDTFRHYESLSESHFQVFAFDHAQASEAVLRLNESKRTTKVLLLSGDASDPADLDEEIFETLIYLETHLTNPDVSIVVEILNPKHQAMIQGFRIKHTIISNKIISLLLSKLAFDIDTEQFYHRLLTIDPEAQTDLQSVVIFGAKDVLNHPFPLSFESIKHFVSSVYESSGKQFVVLGLFRHRQLMVFEGDLTQTAFVLQADDELVLMRVS
jgi:ABC-type multidrug transport system fused ATPase/permease subunit